VAVACRASRGRWRPRWHWWIWRAHGGNFRCRSLARTTWGSRRSRGSACLRCRQRKRAATAWGFLLIRARRIPHRLLLDSISTLTPVGARDLPARRCPRTRWSLLTSAHRACRASYRRSPVARGRHWCWKARSLIHNPCSAGGRSGNLSTLDRLSGGRLTAARQACGRWWCRRSASGYCLGAAPLAPAAVAGPGRLPGRRCAGLPWPVAAPGPPEEASRTPSLA
jgi:hypothetical protein